MIKTKELKNGLIKIYSDLNLMIRDTKTKSIHSEYVVKEQPDLNRYEELEINPYKGA